MITTKPIGRGRKHIEKNVNICCILSPILDIMLSVKNIRTNDACDTKI